jgi:hypothetical protein
VNDKEVVALIKKGTSIPKAAAALKIQPSVMAGHFYRLEPVADPSLKIEGSPAKVADAIVKGRNSGLRWERLAARSGKTVSEVKAIFETKSGTKASESYAGKGRHFGATPEKKAPASKPDKKPAAAAKPGAAKPKARTRADRQAKTGN